MTDVAGLRVAIIGNGRAGGAFAQALVGIGCSVAGPAGRGDDPSLVARDAELVVIATSDAAIPGVAASLRVVPDTLVVHLSGALGATVLGGHRRRGVLHPLVSLPDPTTGAARLTDGAWFAVSADDATDAALLERLVAGLGGRSVRLTDENRVAYHAAAVIASNHLVALFGQVERVAETTGVPLAAFVHLAEQTLAGLRGRSPAEVQGRSPAEVQGRSPAEVQGRSPADVLTGPVARGDWDTVAAHLRALDETERPAYAALAEAAHRLAGRRGDPPEWLRAARCADRREGSVAP